MEEGLAIEAGLNFCPIGGRLVGAGAGAGKAYLSLAAGLARALAMLARMKPDVVIGTGGHASTAVAAAQYLRRKPLVLLDGNAVPGRTNRLLARRAYTVCTAFQESAKWLPEGKATVTGYPVRAAFSEKPPVDEARKRFGLEMSLFTLLVIGGSQGALALNEAVRDSSNELTSSGIQILHQLGRRNEAFEAPWVSHWVQLNYIEDMPGAMSAADLVISRAGVSSISELAAVGCAVCLIPYPFAKDDHQKANALELAEQGRAVMLDQRDLNPGSLSSLVLELKRDSERRQELARRLREWATPDAAAKVASIAMEAAQPEQN